MIEFNPASNQHLSTLFFGGTLKHKVVEPVLDEDGNVTLYKSGLKEGEIKTHKVIKPLIIKGMGLKPLKEWKQKTEGFYKTDEDVLFLLSKSDTDAGKVAKLMLDIRGIEKQLGTYYEGFEKFITPDGCVHQQINMVSTDTGRTSANNPNTQQIPDPSESFIKKHFIAKYGQFVKIDYSQIEIVVQAQLSQDKKYMQDVIDGVDFHTMRLAMKERIPYEEAVHKIKVEKDSVWIDKRGKIKTFSFQRAYGAGSAKIAKETGMTEEDVKELIKNEDLNYEQLKQYVDKLKEIVEFTAEKLPDSDLSRGSYTSCTGRRYYFTNESTPDWLQKRGITHSFRPTKLKNYMIQGTAYDIISIMIGKFWRMHAIHNRDKYLMINFVHDELDLDCKPEHVNLLKNHAIMLTYVKKMMELEFDYNWLLPVKIDIKTAESWWGC